MSQECGMSAEKADYTSVPLAEKHEEPPEIKAPPGFGVRHLQALLLFISLSIGFSMRAHLSVTLVAMTAPGARNATCANVGHKLNLTNLSSADISSTLNTEFVEESHVENCIEKGQSQWNIYRTYRWSKPKQEMILFAFFVGYTSMMMPMGLIAQKFGGKLPICAALLVNGLLSVLTPWMPLLGGWVLVCAGRLLQGMAQAAFFPSVHTLLGKWAPLSERGRLSTYIYTGSQFGTVLAFQVAGAFAGSAALGWPWTFWSCGAASLACCALWHQLGAASPADHPSISAYELAYITKDCNADSGVKKRRTPWKHILTSKAVWGLVATHTGSAVGYLLVLTQIPMYMNKVLGVDIKRNGVYSSLPYISMYLMTLLFGYVSDLVANKKLMSIVNIRRTANSIGMALSGLFLVGFSFVEDTMLAVVAMVLCLGLHSGVHVGFHINHIDLAPNFAGPMMAMSNMIANLSGLAVPVLVSNIVGDDVTNQKKWQILFMMFAALQIVTNLIFVIFAKGTVQEWNFYGEEDEDGKKREHDAMVELKSILAKRKESQKSDKEQ
ncbi:PREDICTED: putative inorganic phosphate cotransporter [Papilio xuthus]|uniref:Inorganic phosphate cotransporter n=1 Tax=Papilio xuthus TaxID=66420 RepID=A0AAJ6ZWE9_PAPXU|nr:PREDICTED: putative inorganic phosphate cotransporter [Papilio xuthus]